MTRVFGCVIWRSEFGILTNPVNWRGISLRGHWSAGIPVIWLGYFRLLFFCVFLFFFFLWYFVIGPLKFDPFYYYTNFYSTPMEWTVWTLCALKLISSHFRFFIFWHKFYKISQLIHFSLLFEVNESSLVLVVYKLASPFEPFYFLNNFI